MNDFLGTLTGKEQNESCFPSLSFKERIIGFLICFAVGLIIQFFSVGSLMGLAFGKVSKFAFLYTLGNIVSLTGYIIFKFLFKNVLMFELLINIF